MKQKWKGLLFTLMLSLLFGVTVGTLKAEAAGDVTYIESIKINVTQPIIGLMADETSEYTIETVPANAAYIQSVTW